MSNKRDNYRKRQAVAAERQADATEAIAATPWYKKPGWWAVIAFVFFGVIGLVYDGSKREFSDLPILMDREQAIEHPEQFQPDVDRISDSLSNGGHYLWEDLLRSAHVLSSLNRYDKATNYLEVALDDARLNGDMYGQGLVLNNMSVVALERGDSELARVRAQNALVTFGFTRDSVLYASSLSNLGSAHFYLVDYVRAARYTTEALSWFRALGERGKMATQYGGLGLIFQYEGDTLLAREYLDSSLTLHDSLGNVIGEAIQRSNIGFLMASQGKVDSALLMLGVSLEMSRDKEYVRGEAIALADIGYALGKDDKHSQSLEYYHSALPLFERTGMIARAALTRANIGMTLMDMGELDSALSWLTNARTIMLDENIQFGLSDVEYDIALIEAKLSDTP